MKRTLVLTAVTLAGVLMFSSPASADHGRASFGFGFGFGFGGGGVHLNYDRGQYRSQYGRSQYGRAPRVHVHHRMPVYAQVWVPPSYEKVVVGYDHCGFPIYRRFVVCAGYYRQEISCYRCDGCSTSW